MIYNHVKALVELERFLFTEDKSTKSIDFENLSLSTYPHIKVLCVEIADCPFEILELLSKDNDLEVSTKAKRRCLLKLAKDKGIESFV